MQNFVTLLPWPALLGGGVALLVCGYPILEVCFTSRGAVAEA